jgi:hypothetical protein
MKKAEILNLKPIPLDSKSPPGEVFEMEAEKSCPDCGNDQYIRSTIRLGHSIITGEEFIKECERCSKCNTVRLAYRKVNNA